MEKRVSMTTFQGTGLNGLPLERLALLPSTKKKKKQDIFLITETIHAQKAAERKYATKSVTHNEWIDYL
jgi:hypothetical protein